jgi:hypothetical protein
LFPEEDPMTTHSWCELKVAQHPDVNLTFYNSFLISPSDANALGVTISTDSVADAPLQYIEAKVADSKVIVYPIRIFKDLQPGTVILSKLLRVMSQSTIKCLFDYSTFRQMQT